MTASPLYNTVSTTSRPQPILTKCCCCIPLRTGCFLLGYISLLINSMQTLALLTLTTFLGVSTHGFDHFDKGPQVDQGPQIESVDKQFLHQIGILLTVILCANMVWLAVNVACLVGLHKKQPGPIRVYVGFATARLMVSLAAFVYLTMTNANTKTLITHSADLGFAAYFILVYYIYAVQLERERAESQERLDISTNDIAFIYPTKTNKQLLIA